MSATYVYCLARAGDPLPALGPGLGLGAGRTALRRITHRGLAAVVSDVSGRLEPTREQLVAHERVNGALATRVSILPLAFGTVLAGDDDVVQLLEAAAGPVRRALRRLDGTVEHAVRIVIDRDRLVGALERKEPDLARLKKEISRRDGASYFARVQYGRLLDQAVADAASRARDLAIHLLSAATLGLRAERPVGDRVVLSLAALVRRDRQPLFDARLERLAADIAPMTLRVVGPFAPYSFVGLRLRLP